MRVASEEAGTDESQARSSAGERGSKKGTALLKVQRFHSGFLLSPTYALHASHNGVIVFLP